MTPRRALCADILGLLLLLLFLGDYVRPSLLLTPTVAAGGDTPCHYPTAVFLADHLLPQLRLNGWYAGAYLGHPLLLYYFPLPFLVMASLAPFVGMPVAFKLGTVLGVFLLPLLAYLSFRLMGLRFPGPLLGAMAATVFLFVEENPIWGGTLASTLAGEFSYTYGAGLACLFLGLTYRAAVRRQSPWGPAALLAVTALAHGYAVIWAGLSVTFFLWSSRRPLRTLGWLSAIALGSFSLAAFFLLPLLVAWGYTTPYDDPWITVGFRNLVPFSLIPLLVPAAFGLLAPLAAWRWGGRPDPRLLYWLWSAAVAASLAAAGPALGIIDVRFVPLAQLAACLAGAMALGLALETLAAPDLAALGLVLLAIVYSDDGTRNLRHWLAWNYSGLETKELWPQFQKLSQTLHGTVADPRVSVEYGQIHEKAGSIRMYETLPLFSGRSTLEGVYNQASLLTHPVYYLASELFALSPNPFKKRHYATFDPDRAFPHLRLFNVSEIVAVSPKLTAHLRSREDVVAVATIPPYEVFRLKDPGPGYVEPVAFTVHRTSRRDVRDASYAWFSARPMSPALVAFTDDPRFPEAADAVRPPEVPLEGGVVVQSVLGPESVAITTSRIGHPLLVKVSYHPRWRAEGADGPFLVTPGLMLVIPTRTEVRLVYGRALADHLGLALTLAAGGLLGGHCWLRRRTQAPNELAPGGRGRRWGGVIPAGLLALLVAARFITG